MFSSPHDATSGGLGDVGPAAAAMLPALVGSWRPGDCSRAGGGQSPQWADRTCTCRASTVAHTSLQRLHDSASDGDAFHGHELLACWTPLTGLCVDEPSSRSVDAGDSLSQYRPINVIHTHIHLTAFFSGTTQVGRYQKGRTNVDFTEAKDSEWQWHQLGKMQVCTWLQTDNHTSIPSLSFLQAGCPSCRPTNSVKELKAKTSQKPTS